MSLVKKFKSIFGFGSSSSEMQTVTVDDRSVGEDIEELIKSKFHVEHFEKEFTIGNEAQQERTEFKYVWGDAHGNEYALTVATDTIYGGYAVEYKMEGKSDFTLREEPADEVVDTLRGVFERR